MLAQRVIYADSENCTSLDLVIVNNGRIKYSYVKIPISDHFQKIPCFLPQSKWRQ
jgi:hypothetical protein